MSISERLKAILGLFSGKGDEREDDAQRLLETQNYIDNRIREASDRLSHENAQKLREIVREKFRFLDFARPYIVWLLAITSLFYFFGGKKWLQEFAARAAQDYLTTNVVHKTLLDTARSNLSIFVESDLRPVQEQVSIIRGQLQSFQAQMLTDQSALQRRVRLQEAYWGARLGALGDYIDLGAISKETNSIGALAQGVLEEVNQFYNDYIHSTTKRVVVDGLSLQPVVRSVEDYIYLLNNEDSGNRIAAATSLFDLAKTNTLQAIMSRVERETNLFVLAYLKGTVRKLTGEAFHGWGSSDMIAWWERHQTNEHYQAPYEQFLSVMTRPQSLMQGEDVIKIARRLIEREPSACKARIAKAQVLMNGGNLAAAEAEIDEAERRLPGYAVAILTRAELLYRRNEQSQAVEHINEAFTKSPSLAMEFAANTNFFGKLMMHPGIKWPTQVKRPE